MEAVFADSRIALVSSVCPRSLESERSVAERRKTALVRFSIESVADEPDLLDVLEPLACFPGFRRDDCGGPSSLEGEAWTGLDVVVWSVDRRLPHEKSDGSTLSVLSTLIGAGAVAFPFPLGDRPDPRGRPSMSPIKFPKLDLFSRAGAAALSNVRAKSPPRSRLEPTFCGPSSAFAADGTIVFAVDAVAVLVRPEVLSCAWVGSGGTGGMSERWPLVCTIGGLLTGLPNEKVLDAACFRIPGTLLDLVPDSTAPWSLTGFLRTALDSSWPCVRSVDEGAVETLLWRDDASVEFVLVVFDEALPLWRVEFAFRQHLSLAVISEAKEP